MPLTLIKHFNLILIKHTLFVSFSFLKVVIQFALNPIDLILSFSHDYISFQLTLLLRIHDPWGHLVLVLDWLRYHVGNIHWRWAHRGLVGICYHWGRLLIRLFLVNGLRPLPLYGPFLDVLVLKWLIFQWGEFIDNLLQPTDCRGVDRVHPSLYVVLNLIGYFFLIFS